MKSNSHGARALVFILLVVIAGTCVGAGNNRSATFPTLKANDAASAIRSATVDHVAAGGAIDHTAVIGPVSADPNPANNRVTTTTAVPSLAEKKNGRIAFSVSDNTVPKLNLIKADGTGQFYFVEAGQGRSPAWSPDGTRLAFGDGYVIVVINADGTGRRTLPIRVSYPDKPAWSPDGTRIAFSAPEGLYIINADGTGLKQITQYPWLGINDTLRWSPDGTRLLYTKNKVYTVNIDGSNYRRLTPSDAAVDGQAAWSPDGTKIVFSSNRDTGSNSNIYVMNADGSGLKRLTNNNQNELCPAWAPDGSTIIFARNTDPHVMDHELYVMNPDVSGQRPLGNSPIRCQPFGIDWQPAPATPEPNTYVIKGKVSDSKGILFNPKIELSGSRTAVTTIDFNGNYSFGNLVEGGGYTVTVTHPAFNFDPPSQTFNNLGADVSNADFTAIFQPLTISGQVTDETGEGIGGARVSLAGSPPAMNTRTDANGFYIFNGLVCGRTYSVMPYGINPSDKFTPSSTVFQAISESKTANFKGTRGGIPLVGNVIGADGLGVGNVTVSLSGGGINRTATTTANGAYSFGQLPGGFTYTLTPEKDGLTFTPATRSAMLNVPLSLNFFNGVSRATLVSAASFSPQAVATGGIVSLFGDGLAGSVKTATGSPLVLDGISVWLTGQNAQELPCTLFFISPQQINFLIPPSTPSFDGITGEVLVTVKRDYRVIAAGLAQIDKVAPSLFTAGSDGRGLASAVVLRIKPDGSQIYEPVVRFDAEQKRFVAIPIDLSDTADQLFLALFGTGFRYRSDLSAVTARIGGEAVETLYAGGHHTFVGLDQINLRIPQSLRGRGDLDVVVSADGKTANSVRINIE
jgi:uncharacterized protein (TIGR03437 family)